MMMMTMMMMICTHSALWMICTHSGLILPSVNGGCAAGASLHACNDDDTDDDDALTQPSGCLDSSSA